MLAHRPAEASPGNLCPSAKSVDLQNSPHGILSPEAHHHDRPTTAPAPQERHRHPPRQPQPPHARRLRRPRVRHAEPRPLRRARRSASRSTTPARCPACPRATTSSAARSTSSGGPGARSSSGRTPLTADLRRAGVTTQLISDHPHLFETGGENYHTDFTAWDYQRGHEGDPWKTRPDPSWSARRRSAAGHDALRQLARLLPRRGRLPRPAHDGAPPRTGSTTTPASTTASSSSSTSSTRTSRSTRPSPTPRCTTTPGRART